MAQKKSPLTKSDVFGPQLMEFNTNDHKVIGTSNDDSIEETLQEVLNEGYTVVSIKGKASTVYYRSNEVDGFVRVVTEDNWSRGMAIWPFTKTDDMQWSKNIDKYFELLMQDDDTIDYLNTRCKEALLTPAKQGKPFNLELILLEARDWLKVQGGKKDFTPGERKSHVFKFLYHEGKQPNNMGRIQNKAHWHLLYNSQDYKNRFYKKGKKR